MASGVQAGVAARRTVPATGSPAITGAVLIGDLVSFYATIEKTGRTSITVSVEVYAQRNPDEEITVKVTEASLTYVAVGPDRRPRPLPPLDT